MPHCANSLQLYYAWLTLCPSFSETYATEAHREAQEVIPLLSSSFSAK